VVDLNIICTQNQLVAILHKAYSKISWLRDCNLTVLPYHLLFLLVKADLAIFGKPYGPYHIRTMKAAKRMNTLILSDFCDFHSCSTPVFIEAASYSDIITVPTHSLSKRILTETSKSSVVIPDSLDYLVLPNNLLLQPRANKSHANSIFWFGLAFSNNLPTHSFREFCRIISKSSGLIHNLDILVEIISESSNRAEDFLYDILGCDSKVKTSSVQWSPESMRASLSTPGYAIIPYPVPVERCEKSANRMELALCSGKVLFSNGVNLPSIDKRLKSFVRPLPLESLREYDLVYDGSRQLIQSIDSKGILAERSVSINNLWSKTIRLALA
jgi:hypothetical protein